MERARQREHVIEESLAARTERDAFLYQQIVEILAGYSRERSPILEIIEYKGLPVGFAENGSVVMAFPVDYGRWTPFSEYLLGGLASMSVSAPLEVKRTELWITGTVSPLTRRELDMLGIKVTEKAGEEIGMMD